MKNKILLAFLALFAFGGFSGNLHAQSVQERYKMVDDSLSALINKADDFKKSNTDSTLYYCDLAADLAIKHKLHLRLAQALTLKSYALVLQGDYEKAEAYCQYAHEIFVQRRCLEGIQYSYRVLGVIFGTTANYSKAQDCNYRALRIAELRKDTSQIIASLNNLSIVYYFQNNDDKALEMNLKVLNMKAKEISQIRGTTLTNIAIIYSENRDFTLAEEYYHKAIEYGRLHNDLNAQVSALSNLARMYFVMKDYNKSLITYFDALEAQKKYVMDISLSTIYMGIGDNYLQLGKEEAALQNYEAAIDNAIQTGSREKLKDVYSKMADLKYKKEQYKEAFNYLTEAYKLKDSLSSKEVKEKIASLEKLYESEKKDHQIEQLSITEQVKQNKIEQQKRRMFFLVFLFFGAAVLLSILYFQNRKIKSVYKKLVIKNLELMQKEKNRSAESTLALSQLAESLSEDGPVMPEVIGNGEEGIEEAEVPDKEPETTPAAEIEDNDKPKYQKSLLTLVQKEEMLARILDAIESRKRYLDPELSIEGLSDELGIYRKYISQVINELLGKNFTMLINEYRVKEARNLLVSKEYQKYTLEAIGQVVGFHSKSSFNTAFKKFTGITPSFFRETAFTSKEI